MHIHAQHDAKLGVKHKTEMFESAEEKVIILYHVTMLFHDPVPIATMPRCLCYALCPLHVDSHTDAPIEAVWTRTKVETQEGAATLQHISTLQRAYWFSHSELLYPRTPSVLVFP